MSQPVRIGIFEGKKEAYNVAILEALFKHGPLRNWELAKKIHESKNKTKNPEISYSRTQRLYSVIVRKGGRLQELEQKEYILCQERKWELCFPKALIILIKKPEIGPDMNAYYLRKPPFSFPKLKRVRKLKLPFGLQLQVDPNQLQSAINDFVASLDILKLHRFMAKRLQDLIQEGIDLDRIRNENLALLVFQDMKGSESWRAVQN